MSDFRTAGIVAEFNPFHNGHRHLIQMVRKDLEADGIVAVMSGSFVQRGEPAVYNKWKRAEMAVSGGVDLVLELPAVYSTASAGWFAEGSVGILEAMGNIDYLAFGSEHGETDLLLETARFLKEHDEELSIYIKEMKKQGISYPKARELFLREKLGDEAGTVIAEPNNILAVEYLKNTVDMKPYTIKRRKGDHLKSATELRNLMREVDGKRLDAMDRNYFLMIRDRILTSSVEELADTPDGSFDLASRAKEQVRYATSINDLILKIKSKDQTYSRINRFLLQSLLRLGRNSAEEGSLYIKVLAFNQTGATILKDAKKRETVSVPVIDNINREIFKYPEIEKTLSADILASDIYNLLEDRNMYDNSDYVKKPIFHKMQPL